MQLTPSEQSIGRINQALVMSHPPMTLVLAALPVPPYPYSDLPQNQCCVRGSPFLPGPQFDLFFNIFTASDWHVKGAGPKLFSSK
jgi:hypothetical protein